MLKYDFNMLLYYCKYGGGVTVHVSHMSLLIVLHCWMIHCRFLCVG